MKKLVILATALFITAAASAQINIGAKAGVNASNYRGSDAEGTKGKIGFYAGATAEVPLSGNISFAPELVYSLQGVKSDMEDEGNAKLNASYLNIPLLARYKFENGFYFEAGVQPGLLLSANVKADGEKADVKDQYKSFDLSIPVGIGFQTQSNFGVSLRYNLGLSKLDKEGEAKVYNGVAQLGITYRLFQN